MKRPRLLCAVLFAISLVSCSTPCFAQAVGDEFWSSSGPGFIYSARPAPDRDNAGHWAFTDDGETVWVPDSQDGSCPDAFMGFQDQSPPDKVDETFGPIASDSFSATSSTYEGRFTPDQLRWAPERMPLRVYISATIEDARGGNVRKLIEESLDTWSSALPGSISWRRTWDFKEADIYFLQRDTENNEWADHERSTSKKGLDLIRVSLLEQSVLYLPERRLKSVLLHETGHAFGLIDHLPDKTDAMSLYVCDPKSPVTSISQHDVAALRRLYTPKPRPSMPSPESDKLAQRYPAYKLIPAPLSQSWQAYSRIVYGNPVIEKLRPYVPAQE